MPRTPHNEGSEDLGRETGAAYDPREEKLTRRTNVSERSLEDERRTEGATLHRAEPLPPEPAKTAPRDRSEFTAGSPPGSAQTSTTERRPGAQRSKDYPPEEGTERAASRKGFWVGVLTFAALVVIDVLTGGGLVSLTFLDTMVYAVIGILIGLAVKHIDLARHGGRHRAAHHYKA